MAEDARSVTAVVATRILLVGGLGGALVGAVGPAVVVRILESAFGDGTPSTAGETARYLAQGALLGFVMGLLVGAATAVAVVLVGRRVAGPAVLRRTVLLTPPLAAPVLAAPAAVRTGGGANQWLVLGVPAAVLALAIAVGTRRWVTAPARA